MFKGPKEDKHNRHDTNQDRSEFDYAYEYKLMRSRHTSFWPVTRPSSDFKVLK